MVSNQSLARLPQALPLRLAVASLLLCTMAGCAMFGSARREAPAEAPSPPPAAAVVDHGPQSAVDAAIARGEGAPAPVAQAEAPSSPDLLPTAPRSYTVKRGDTLWGIASLFLRDPWLWPEIWYVNPEVRNPHLIYPGDVLALAYGADGRPQIRLAGGGGGARVQPLVRSTPIEGPIATIPYSAIAAFLGRPTVLSKEDVQGAPQVIAFRDEHVVGANGAEVYVRGLGESPAGRYNIVRQGQPLRDPDTKKLLGYMGVYTGAARIERVDEISKAVLTDSARETQAGDLLFADDVQATTDLVPHVPARPIDGRIVAVVDGVLLIGQYQVVAINRGVQHGLEPGHVLAIDEAGDVVRTPCRRSLSNWCVGGDKVRLPDERAGTLLVFRTYEQMSFGLIVSATTPVRIADRVRNP